MDLNSLEIAPADELVLRRTDGTPNLLRPNAKGRRDRKSDPERGACVDEQGPVRRSHLVVLLEKDGALLSEHPIEVTRSGYLVQTSGFEAPDTWDECWLSDGRVRVRAGTGGPAGFINGLVWK